MSIVEKAAAIIEPGAYATDWFGGTGPDARPVKLSGLSESRRNYFRASAECRAIEILRIAASMTQAELRAALIEYERDGWRRLGLPMDDPELREVIERKYSVDRSAQAT